MSGRCTSLPWFLEFNLGYYDRAAISTYGRVMAYDHDIFVSYRRTLTVGQWVQNTWCLGFRAE